MQKIDWNQFRIKNPNYRKAFEELCYHLFCRKFKIGEGIFGYQNQTGIEKEPIRIGRDYIGFQAKYFDAEIDKDQIIDSLKKAKYKNQKLTKVVLYINQEFLESSKRDKKDSKKKEEIESFASQQKIKLEWFVRSNFEILLQNPPHFDLAQLYFGLGDEYGFIRSCCDSKILTFLQSSEHIDLPFIDKNKAQKKNIKKSILSSQSKTFLLVGHPGSGKSVFMHKLLREMGGLDKKNQKAMRDTITKNQAIPMLVNLKDCIIDSLENIIRNRQKDFNLRNPHTNTIYLFDGLDELDEDKADKVLSYIARLEEGANTKKVIISCRSGNANRLKAKVYLQRLIEYQISILDESYLNRYFEAKNNSNKLRKLNALKKKNNSLASKINDILLIRLLWDTIDKIDENSSIIDLISNKIDILLKHPLHKKNIDELNLLNPKENAIIDINREIAFEFYKRFQFRFPLSDLQQLILHKFPRMDYKSVNYILSYLMDMFFDGSFSEQSRQTYVYQHRRYQEFFFAQKLKEEYEREPRVLRDFRVLSNQELFDELFLPFLRKEYERDKDLCRLIELNLIDVYLGRHRGWGADNPYYANSSEFIPSLANQKDELFEQLLEDDNLQIKRKFFIELDNIPLQFDKLKKDKNDYRAKDYLKGIWEGGISSLLSNIVIFWDAGKQSLAKKLLKNLDEITQLFKKNKFLENLEDHDHIRDPFWNRWEDWLYILIVIKGRDIKDLLNKLIRENYKNFSDEKRFTSEESGKEKLIKGFFRTCLRKGKDIFKITDTLDSYEFSSLLSILLTEEFLPVFVKEKSFYPKVKKYLETHSQSISEENSHLLFYKKFLNMKLSPEEITFAEGQLSKLLKERPIDWHMYKSHFKYAVFSYSIGKNTFLDLLKKDNNKDIPRYYNELQLYAAVFSGFIGLLKDKERVEVILRDYLSYVETHQNTFRLYLKVNMSFLWALIFAHCGYTTDKMLPLKRRLIKEENKIVPYSFFYKLYYLNKSVFDTIINESELEVFENELNPWNDDLPSYVDRCFNLAMFFSGINRQKAEMYIAKGINEGILRHGWRKDSIVSYFLVEALEILWRNNWLSKNIVTNYAREVFELAFRVSEITDGKGTVQGPYNVIELVADNNIELAEELKNELVKREGHYNVWNRAITAVILGKVKLGSAITTIEENMKEYRLDYTQENKPLAGYYEEKFKVYLSIVQNDLYTEEEKEESFNKAYDLVELMKKNKVEYHLRDIDFFEEKTIFMELCKKYGKQCNVSLEEKKDDYKIKPKMSEETFVDVLKKAKTSSQIRGLYKQLSNYKNGVVLTGYESWKILINKTCSVMGDIELFIKLIRDNSFPHTDFYTANSKYYHYGLAEALNRIDTREEILKYLYTNSGHGGFLNIMRAFEVNKDKDMCLKLFNHFIKFCKFLVY